MENEKRKTYLGDGAYIQVGCYHGEVVLTAEDGSRVLERIVLDPSAVDEMLRWLGVVGRTVRSITRPVPKFDPGEGEMEEGAAALEAQVAELKADLERAIAWKEEYKANRDHFMEAAERAEEQAENLSMLLRRLAVNPTVVSGDEIRDALQRWGVGGSPLREHGPSCGGLGETK